MKEVAARFATDDTVQTLYAEAAMDTQPWDYWEAAGARPKGRASEIVRALETVLKRNPSHPGAIHLYIHAVEASTNPERALPHAKRLAALMPGAGHIVHMPAHIYYRVGLYRDSLAANVRAIQVDENYFKTSPSDPLYKAAYYPHNIHFVMVSAQMGGDAKTAIDAARKLDASMPIEAVKAFAVLQPVKASPYTTHAQFSDPDTILQLAAPSDDLVLVKTMYHYARAVAFAARKDTAGARARSTRSRGSSATPISSRSRRGRCPPAKSCRPAGSSRAVASPTPRRPRRRGEGVRERDRHRRRLWRTTSHRTGTTRCASRSARCACGRAGSTTPRRRSASRSPAYATAAGRSPAWSRSRRSAATPRPSKALARRSSAPGSAPGKGRTSPGCDGPLIAPFAAGGGSERLGSSPDG
jgi:hypothetical protein